MPFLYSTAEGGAPSRHPQPQPHHRPYPLPSLVYFQDFLVVFAAGNCGDTTDDTVDNCSVLEEDEGTVLSPAQGKNVVAVGSSESGGEDSKDMDTVSYFSSKGPTIDGRIKPDVVAPGDPNYSASADPSGETCEMAFQTVRMGDGEEGRRGEVKERDGGGRCQEGLGDGLFRSVFFCCKVFLFSVGRAAVGGSP